MRSKITIAALAAVIIFFVLLFVSFERIGNEDAGKKADTQKGVCFFWCERGDLNQYSKAT